MPRKARKLLGNIIIHNMVQGINKEKIFDTIKQKEKYKKLMKEESEKHHTLIIAYCIMGNHVHLLTYSQTIDNLSQFMKSINGKYAQYYNKSNERVGYVFRNRFYSKPILGKEQLYKCIKYIHMNPVKAGLCLKENDYEYSSYQEYKEEKEFIKSKIYQMIFQSDKNYFQKLESTKYESMKIHKEKCDLKEILKKYIAQNNIDFTTIPVEPKEIKKFIFYLKTNEYEFSKNEIAELLQISRAKLYRILRKDVKK